MPRTSVVELQASLLPKHPPLVIDVRGPASTQVDPRRIPGAISALLSEIDALATTLPRERDIVVYCNCPNEESAARAALALRQRGLTRVWPLAGRLDA